MEHQPQTPEQRARYEIDRLLTAAGWAVQDVAAANIHAARGVAVRELPLAPGFGVADYLLYVDGQAAAVIEAKKQGATLSGVEIQSSRYAQGLPASLPAWRRPLPFLYESTGAETRFTNGLDPEPRARAVFAFHRPELLAAWLDYARLGMEIPPFRRGSAPRRRPFSPRCATCRRLPRSGARGEASSGCGRPRSPPSATSKSPSPRTSPAP